MSKSKTPFGIAFVAFWELMMGSLGILFITFITLLGAYLTVGELIVVSFTTIWLVTGWGIMSEKSWAWKMGIISSTVSLIGSLTLWLIAFIFLEVFGLGIIFWPPILFYLTRPTVKNFMSKSCRSLTVLHP